MRLALLTLLSLVLVPSALAAGPRAQTISGTISANSGSSITVTSGDRSVTCAVRGEKAQAALARWGVGAKAAMACRRDGDRLVLSRLSRLDSKDADDDSADALRRRTTTVRHCTAHTRASHTGSPRRARQGHRTRRRLDHRHARRRHLPHLHGHRRPGALDRRRRACWNPCPHRLRRRRPSRTARPRAPADEHSPQSPHHDELPSAPSAHHGPALREGHRHRTLLGRRDREARRGRRLAPLQHHAGR